MQTKTCNICNVAKPISEFYRRTTGVLFLRCKHCQNSRTLAAQDNEEWRARHRTYLRSARNSPAALARAIRHAVKYREKYPEKTVAKRAVRAAIVRGVLVRPAVCERCGETPAPLRDGRPAIQAHHEDYSRPLDVAWMCSLCHVREHISLPTPPSEEGGNG